METAGNMAHRNTYTQFVKFLAVGCLNTGVTLIVIALCKSLLGVNPYLSNFIGYAAGLVNSFVWNRQWVFRAKGAVQGQALRFLGSFVVCYALQLGVVWVLENRTPLGAMTWQIGSYTLSGYGVATVLAMGVYTVANFLINKLFSFSR